jgi:uncharacterized protein YbjQ (UPF0145 family)
MTTRPFTSALRPREAFAVAHAGFVPIRQVMGAAFFSYTKGRPYGAPYRLRRDGHVTREYTRLSDPYNKARRAAIDRLRDEAVACRADAVVGVTVERGERDWARGLVEFIASGTAVRAPRYEIEDPPLLCTLSGQEVAELVAYGHWPVGIAGGSTAAYVSTSRAQRRRTRQAAAANWNTFGRVPNQELPDWSAGLSEAYALAMRQVERDAAAQRAHGLVGLALDRSQETIENDDGMPAGSSLDLIVTVHALGTAIITLRNDPPPPPPLSTILPLS